MVIEKQKGVLPKKKIRIKTYRTRDKKPKSNLVMNKKYRKEEVEELKAWKRVGSRAYK